MSEDNLNKFVFTAKYKEIQKTFSNKPLNVLGDYECPHCKEEITLEQIKDITSLTPSQEKRVKESLVFINKYRKDFKLDTCLRKAHFIAQCILETNKFKATVENTNYNLNNYNLNNYFTRKFKKQVIDDVILKSLEDYLSKIFTFTDKDGKLVTKTNAQIKVLVKGINVETKYLYGGYKGKDLLIKTVKEKITDKEGKESDQVKYNIYITKHKHFAIPLLSRAYGNRLENKDELSRDGYIFRGRGMKQLTGRVNYRLFTEFRNKNPFPEDTSGKIDFTKTTDLVKLEGNYDKIGDTDNIIYGVQSALWYWIGGNGAIYEHSDKDDVFMVSWRINGGFNGFYKKKRAYY